MRSQTSSFSSVNQKTTYNSGLFNFLYANTNGFRSKSESTNQIIEKQDTDLAMLIETKAYSKSPIDIRGFQSFSVVKMLEDVYVFV